MEKNVEQKFTERKGGGHGMKAQIQTEIWECSYCGLSFRYENYILKNTYENYTCIRTNSEK